MCCNPCWSADITNLFDSIFSDLNNIHSIEENIISNNYELPEVGEYYVLDLGGSSTVAVSTLSSAELAEKLYEFNPNGLCIAGKLETENIGVEKVIKNVISVPSIKYLILCGKESEGHFSGNTILCLVNNGVDDKSKVRESKGKKPILINTTKDEIEAFRNQVELVDMIGCEDVNQIITKIKELSIETMPKPTNKKIISSNFSHNKTMIITAEEKDPHNVKLDKEGYFVIVPKIENDVIIVEHYSNDNQLLHIVKGNNARNIYWTIIENKWVSELSHAAYLGKELAKAEMSMSLKTKYVQDNA